MTTSARLLRLLALLQRHRHWSGTDLAATLEVSERTLRRDIERLRQLGYPVESTRGSDGGYELVAGATLPPLLLDEREGMALAVGLHLAAHNPDPELADASLSALAKVVTMLPATLRQRVELVGEVTDAGRWGTAPTSLSPESLGIVAQACRDGVRLRFDYTAADGAATERYVEPYRLVTLASRWYLVAYDADRRDWRTFRVDRLTNANALRNTFDRRPLPADDLATYVRERIESLRPATTSVAIVVHAPAAEVGPVVGRWATVTELPSGSTKVEMETGSLDWPLLVLSQLDADFDVVCPAELTERLRSAGERFVRCAV